MSGKESLKCAEYFSQSRAFAGNAPQIDIAPAAAIPLPKNSLRENGCSAMVNSLDHLPIESFIRQAKGQGSNICFYVARLRGFSFDLIISRDQHAFRPELLPPRAHSTPAASHQMPVAARLVASP